MFGQRVDQFYPLSMETLESEERKTMRKKEIHRHISSHSFPHHKGESRKETSSNDLAGEPLTVCSFCFCKLMARGNTDVF